MKVKDIMSSERPREKAFHKGVKELSNRELIAVLLRCGTKEKNALELADEILNLKGTLGDLGVASLQEITKIKGIKDAKGVELLAAFEIGKRIAFDVSCIQKKIEQPEDIIDWLNQEIGYQKQEHFLVLFLNQKNQVITYKTMFIGTLTNASVHPREIFKVAMQLDCARILCVHNHPSGDPAPSEADILLTQAIENSGKMVSIPLMDHIIVSRNSYVSFRQKRLID